MLDIYNPYIRVIFNKLSDKYKIKIGLPKAYMEMKEGRVAYSEFIVGTLDEDSFDIFDNIEQEEFSKPNVIDKVIKAILNSVDEYMKDKNSTIYLRSMKHNKDGVKQEISVRLGALVKE